MKAFATFSLIFVTGMLGTSVAQESHQVANKVTDVIRWWQTVLSRKTNYSFNEGRISEWKNSIMPKCKINGAPDATNAVVENFEIYFNSAAALMNETQRQLDIAANDPHDGLNAAIAATCHWITTMNELTKKVRFASNRCLNSTELAHMDLVNNVSSQLAQYVCENNGEHVLALLTDDGRECFISSSAGLDHCMLTSFSTNTTIFKEPSYSLDPNFPGIIVLNAQSCREFQDLQQCTVGVLQGCRSATFSSEVNALINILKNASGCEDLLKI